MCKQNKKVQGIDPTAWEDCCQSKKLSGKREKNMARQKYIT